MRADLPTSHVQESMKLEARAFVELFKIDMRRPDGTMYTLYLCPQKTVTWQGATWTGDAPCTISETTQNISGETTRPKFSTVNPDGVWSRYVHQKWADGAIISRYRVLRPDLDADINAFQLNTWRMSRVVTLSKNLVVLELRTALDGHNFKIPGETYRPPKYPTVSVQ